MIIRIPNYQYGYRVVSLAKCETSKNQLLQERLGVLYINGGKLVLMPEDIVLSEDCKIVEQFNRCDDYDVFEVDAFGKAFLYYNNESGDNSFVLTGKCNSNCVMCPASELTRRNGSTMNLAKLLELVNHIPSDAKHFTITGGEPFLVGKDIFIFFEAIKNKFLQAEFLLLTNGRIFCNVEYCKCLKETLPKNIIVGIPLHGYNAATHDSITQTPGSFRQTFAGIKNILSLGFRVELRVVVSRLTADYLTNVAELILKSFHDVYCVKFIGLEMLGNAAKNQDLVWISYSDAFQKSKKAIVQLILGGVDVGIYNFPLCAVDKEFWSICARSITDYKVRFTEQCRFCNTKDACGGIFSGTYRLAKKDVRPL